MSSVRPGVQAEIWLAALAQPMGSPSPVGLLWSARRHWASVNETTNMKGYADLADLPEDKRIELIVHRVIAHGETIGVVLENEPKKIERYRRKIHAAAAVPVEIEQLAGLVPNTVTLKIKLKPIDVSNN